ncbi:ATP-binding protein [Bradyrhizobium elkanii]|uniref:ATP-binding protein n=1 Tax=Bradyrhizobium elkanii TaxID=29448 RepID=UPI001AEAC7CC|nr:ATP-binding protein [Bradyrhizobium elkanii]MBP2427188.1 signal transduction histidine kinase [Bradyrhizobium elkanii]MCP1970385.1 signal transduction histidine kinase [Bradyrhizobium elkanii]MCS4108108.1 signal transduction histidine kinase [Bradyrhizobium elkanii]WLA95074.1 ATP-binding protein [Bradyrhizobium elkanii]
MSWTRRIAALFSFHRISGQIAALILLSLVLIHALIGLYFVSQKPRSFADRPVHQFQLVARLLSEAPAADRATLLRAADRAFPRLHLTLRDAGPGSSDDASSEVPGVDDIDEFSSKTAPAAVRLPDGALFEATIGPTKMPPFFGGFWVSTFQFLFVSVTLLGVWAGRALSAPLSAFARAAENFSISQAAAPLPETGPEEIRAAAVALNRMRERITTLMNDRTRMLAAISHDLRTPITRLRLRSEYIENDAQRAETLHDLDQMQAMLESVLSFLSGGSAAKPTLVNVAALLQTICEQFSDCGHVVRYQGPVRASFLIRPSEISRTVTNLVENALRFGSEVDILLTASADQVTIDVSDDGPGIPEHCRAEMLKPFVRGDEARTMDETSGFGLGLSIAQAMVCGHGGELSLHDNTPHGLLVRIKLPGPVHLGSDRSGASASRSVLPELVSG